MSPMLSLGGPHWWKYQVLILWQEQDESSLGLLQKKDRENTGVESRGVVACNASSYWHLKPDGFWHSS